MGKAIHIIIYEILDWSQLELLRVYRMRLYPIPRGNRPDPIRFQSSCHDGTGALYTYSRFGALSLIGLITISVYFWLQEIVIQIGYIMLHPHIGNQLAIYLIYLVP